MTAMPVEKKSADRQDGITIAKGIGIISVIVVHTRAPFILRQMIYGFPIQLFFMIAGILYDKQKWERLGFSALMRKRAESYLIPYFVLSGINLILNGIDEWIRIGVFDEWLTSQIYHMGWIIYSPGLGKLTPQCTPLWFLPCLFLAYIVFYFTVRLKLSLQIISCILMLFLNRAVYMVLPRTLVRALPWHMEVALVGAVLMVMGYHLKELEIQKYLEKNKVLFFLLIGVGVFAGYLNIGKVDFASNSMGNFLFLLLYSTVMTLTIISFGNIISGTILGRFLAFCGNSTLIFMGFNYYFNIHTREIWNRIPVLAAHEYTWWINAIVVIICLVLLSYIWIKVKKGVDNHADKK